MHELVRTVTVVLSWVLTQAHTNPPIPPLWPHSGNTHKANSGQRASPTRLERSANDPRRRRIASRPCGSRARSPCTCVHPPAIQDGYDYNNTMGLASEMSFCRLAFGTFASVLYVRVPEPAPREALWPSTVADMPGSLMLEPNFKPVWASP